MVCSVIASPVPQSIVSAPAVPAATASTGLVGPILGQAGQTIDRAIQTGASTLSSKHTDL